MASLWLLNCLSNFCTLAHYEFWGIRTLWWQIFGWIVNYLMPRELTLCMVDETEHMRILRIVSHIMSIMFIVERKIFFISPNKFFSVVDGGLLDWTRLNKLPANIDNQKIYVYDRFRTGFESQLWSGFYNVRENLIFHLISQHPRKTFYKNVPWWARKVFLCASWHFFGAHRILNLH